MNTDNCTLNALAKNQNVRFEATYNGLSVGTLYAHRCYHEQDYTSRARDKNTGDIILSRYYRTVGYANNNILIQL